MKTPCPDVKTCSSVLKTHLLPLTTCVIWICSVTYLYEHCFTLSAETWKTLMLVGPCSGNTEQNASYLAVLGLGLGRQTTEEEQVIDYTGGNKKIVSSIEKSSLIYCCCDINILCHFNSIWFCSIQRALQCFLILGTYNIISKATLT